MRARWHDENKCSIDGCSLRIAVYAEDAHVEQCVEIYYDDDVGGDALIAEAEKGRCRPTLAPVAAGGSASP